MLFIGGAAAAARNFYVSPQGSDGAEGLSPSTAWRTLARASQQQLLLGDTLSLERNSSWLNDPLTVQAAHDSSIGAYGDATLPRPLLQMGRPIDRPTTCVSIHASGRVSVGQLHLSGCSTGLAITSHGNASGITVSGNFFRDIRTPFAQYSPPNPNWASALALRGAAAQNVTIRNNIASRYHCNNMPE
jgi:hypothetical protein